MHHIILEEGDLLRSHLFNASKSKMIMRIRKRNILIISLIFIAFGLGNYFIKGAESANYQYFIGVGVFYLLAAPLWTRYSYKRHYQRYVRQNQKHLIGQSFDMEITDTSFKITSPGLESTLGFDEIGDIYEIKDCILIRFDEVNTILIPAHYENYEDLKAELKSKLASQSVEWNEELNWYWK